MSLKLAHKINFIKTIAILLIQFCCANTIFSQQAKRVNLDFYHLKTEEGLSQNSISSINQDTIGQMWFATKNGIIRYDAKQFYEYKHIPDKPNSIGSNFCNQIFVSSKGELWVATNKGANKYNYENNYFERFVNEKLTDAKIISINEDTNGLFWFLDAKNQKIFSYNEGKNIFNEFVYTQTSSAHLINLYIYKKNRFWLNTDKNFILQFNPLNNSYKKIEFINKKDAEKLPKLKSYAANIIEDYKGNILIGTHYGFIVEYNHNNNEQERFYFNKNLKRGYYYLMFLKEDNQQNLWVGTWFGGLYKISKNRKQIVNYLPKKDNKNSISNNILVSCYQDKAGYMWFGTEFAGINILKKNKKFFTISHNSNKSLPALPFLNVAFDSASTVWLGTDVAGLFYFKRNHPERAKNINKLLKNTKRIFSLLYDTNNLLQIGTENGLYTYNPYTKQIKNYKYEKNNYNSIGGKNIISLCEDKNGNLWLGSIYRGITKFNKATKKFIHFTYDKDNPNSLSNNYVSSIFCDSYGNIWVGTEDGLNKFNESAGNFTIFKNNFKNKNSISSNKINCIFEKNNKLWIGTDGGLNYYDFETKKFSSYNKENGLPSDDIKGIIDDNNGNLWISTTHNISKFNILTKHFVNFGKSDGLESEIYINDYGAQELEFYENFAKKDKNGYLYFGGISGMYIFHPDSLAINNYVPPVIIENIKVNGNQINKNNSIILNPSQNHIEFTLCVLNFIQPEKNKYAYFLENQDSTWVYSENEFKAEYFNLPSGNYIFH